MRKSRFTEGQIIGILREYEAGAKLAELCRRHNVSQTTFYEWRAKFGGMTVSDAKRRKGLQDESRRLEQLLAEPMQNGSIESFNGRFREECLDQTLFTSLAEARHVIEAWRVDDNLHRPHTSLRMATPAAFAAFAKRQGAPAPELCGGSPPEPLAALTPPVLSAKHGFP